MKRYEPVKQKYWQHDKTGATASIYGANPSTSREDDHNWKIKELGYIVRDNAHGTVFNPQCLPVHASLELAQAYCDKENATYDEKVKAFNDSKKGVNV